MKTPENTSTVVSRVFLFIVYLSMLNPHERSTKNAKLGRNIQDKQNVQLFQNVHYAIDETLPRSQQKIVNLVFQNYYLIT
jgi:hypothetical protein